MSAAREVDTAHGLVRLLLTTGLHGPVAMTVWQRSREQLETYYLLYGSAGANIKYRGHMEDLLAARCVRVQLDGLRHGRFSDDGHGGVFALSGKSAAGKRVIAPRHVALSYVTNNRALAASLPGMREHFPHLLQTMRSRPVLRLVGSSKRRPPSPAATLNALVESMWLG